MLAACAFLISKSGLLQVLDKISNNPFFVRLKDK